ncbi:MAG TPA: PQQ-binding-like beta-propeller repeat protein [Solirubrobacterales bacterium]|jgi:glucose dehydrogenase
MNAVSLRVASAVAALALLVAVVAGCGGGSSSSSTTSTTTPAETSAGGTGESGESHSASFEGEEPSSSWPTVGNDIGGTRHSTASQITAQNVSRLKPAYLALLEAPGSLGSGSENNPIESEGVIYASSSSENPVLGAYDASTGKMLWQTSAKEVGIRHSIPNIGTRGVAIGGGQVYVEEPGGVLVAFDQKTGKPAWKALVNTQRVYQYSQPTPVYWDGLVYIGQSGSDIIGGLRGFVKAFDAKTGKLVWTFHTLPKPNTAGAKTWNSTSELKDGGGGVWTNPVIDPKLGLVYFPTGNPWPDIGGRGPGDEHYLDGVIALDLKTGKLRWFYQTTHHDEWDYDCAQPPLLWTQEIGGKSVNGLSIGCKNGYVYELDRETGKPVTPVKEEELSNAKSDPEAKAYDEKMGWRKQNGEPLTEPIPVDAGEVTPHCAQKNLLPPEAPDGKGFEYACAYMYFGKDHYTAGWNGASLDWQPSSYDPELGYTYYCSNVGIHAAKLKSFDAEESDNTKVFPELYENGEGKGATEPRAGWLTALDLQDNKAVWQKRFPTGVECAAGSTTTAGGLVFMSDSTGKLHAFEAKSGREVWSYARQGLEFRAPPVVYEVGGTEYVSVVGTLEGKAALIGFALNAAEPSQLAAPKPANGPANGEKVFESSCGTCHTLAAAGTKGTVGPNLDELAPSESTVEHQVINGGGKMPAFKGQLSAAEIKAVSKYVAQSAGR